MNSEAWNGRVYGVVGNLVKNRAEERIDAAISWKPLSQYAAN